MTVIAREIPRKVVTLKGADKGPQFIVIDLFCGAGGTSTGYHMAVDKYGNLISYVVAAINHDYLAIESHHFNYPEVEHFAEDIRLLYMSEHFIRLKRLVNLYRAFYPDAKVVLWASLECTNFSKAKGGMSRDADSRTLANHLPPYIIGLDPDYVKIENVVEFMAWGPMKIKVAKKHDDRWDLKMSVNKKTEELEYDWEPISSRNGEDFLVWKKMICSMGYYDEWTQINSADHGAYTSRNRLFGCFAKPGLPIIFPEATHSKKVTKVTKKGLQPWKAVKEKIDFSDEGTSIWGREKDLVPKTKWRIYNGAIRWVAGGYDAFLLKTYATASNGHGTYPTSKPAHVITTRDAHNLVSAFFISKYYSGDDWSRNTSIDQPLDVIPTENRHALVSSVFISKYFSGNPWSKNTSIEKPLGTIRTVDGQAVVLSKRFAFLAKYYGTGITTTVNTSCDVIPTKDRYALVRPAFLINYNHSSNSNSVNETAPVIVCSDKLAIAQVEQARYFIDKQYSGSGNNANHQSIEKPAGTILKNDKHSLISTVPFIYRPFSNGGSDSSVYRPAGAIMPIAKLNLVNVEKATSFIMPTNFNNMPTSLETPMGTITANRKWHYLVNPQWGIDGNGSIHNPSPVIIARQDKAPLSITSVSVVYPANAIVIWTQRRNPAKRVIIHPNGNVFYIVSVHDDDITKKLIEFMYLYGIVDIKMRMLKVQELKTIQGFPADYELQGSQSHQKKFIGNSVVPAVVKAWAEALHKRLLAHNKKPSLHQKVNKKKYEHQKKDN